MQLQDFNKSKLSDKGLKLFGDKYRLTVYKPMDVEGNFIPKWESLPIITGYDEKSEVSKEYISNCPPISLWFIRDKWHVIHHEWVPGPGPGDFDIEFDEEDKAVDFILSYYFADNKYFEEKKNYVTQSRNSIKIDELQIILKAALNKIEDCFKDVDEIDFETFAYNKLPNEVWKNHKIKTNSQYTMVKFDLGVLRNDVSDLKELVYKKRQFTHGDLQKLGSVITELTILMEKKNCG